MKLFSGSANKSLTERVASALNIKVSPLEIHVFPDKEKRVRVIDKVLDENTVVIQPTNTLASENYMELFFIVDALKRSGAKSIIAVIPYLGYQRQDHIFRTGEAVSLEVIIKILDMIGVDKIIVFDLHSIKIQELFHIPIAHLSALKIFAEKIKQEKWNKNDTVLVSPDMGGIRRIKLLSSMLDNMPYATIEKNRDLETGKVCVTGSEGLNDFKRAIIVDDMISSGGTIAVASEFLAKRGAKEIYVFATHPVFSKEAKGILRESKALKVFVTDTIQIPEDKKFAKLQILSVASMIAKELKATNH